MSNDLKLFVWEGVLADYTDGIMFALACDADEARKLISEKDRGDHPRISGLVLEDLKAEPKVFETPVGFAVWGGG